jgi:hypothetical protein
VPSLSLFLYPTPLKKNKLLLHIPLLLLEQPTIILITKLRNLGVCIALLTQPFFPTPNLSSGPFPHLLDGLSSGASSLGVYLPPPMSRNS